MSLDKQFLSLNLSLPDLELCKAICAYFEVDIKDFLEIEDKGNFTDIYQQMSIMFTEMNKNNKRTKIFNIILVVICIISLALTSVIYLKNQELNKLVDYYLSGNNEFKYNLTSVNYLNEDSEIYDTINNHSYMHVNEYNLTNETIEIEYQFTLKKYNDNTSIKIQFTDGDETLITLDLIKKSENVFYIKKVIPLADYFNVYLLIDDGQGNMQKEDIGYNNCNYYRYMLENPVNITVPLKSDNTLDLRHLVYKPTSNYHENVVGSLKATLYLNIYDKTKKHQILKTAIALDKEKILSLNTSLPYDEDFYLGLWVEKQDENGSSMWSIFNSGGSKDDIEGMSIPTKIEAKTKEFNLYPYNKTIKGINS